MIELQRSLRLLQGLMCQVTAAIIVALVIVQEDFLTQVDTNHDCYSTIIVHGTRNVSLTHRLGVKPKK